MVVVRDDAARENEGDITIAAQFVTPQVVNFMARRGGGLISLALPEQRCDELDLWPIGNRHDDPLAPAFSVSFDAADGVSTGISAFDRAHTLRVAASPETPARALARPGHIFALRGNPGGILARPGHTEAALELTALAGLTPAAVVCQVLADDGSPARDGELRRFCGRHGLRLLEVGDLVAWRRASSGGDEPQSRPRDRRSQRPTSTLTAAGGAG
jgi:3,4-dihydroxy 2-butanone 4-phosphate synthase/GTP cyclohydrolase II